MDNIDDIPCKTMSFDEIKDELKKFENKHDIPSKDFYEAYMQDMPIDNTDTSLWLLYYEIYIDLIEDKIDMQNPMLGQIVHVYANDYDDLGLGTIVNLDVLESDTGDIIATNYATVLLDNGKLIEQLNCIWYPTKKLYNPTTGLWCPTEHRE